MNQEAFERAVLGYVATEDDSSQGRGPRLQAAGYQAGKLLFKGAVAATQSRADLTTEGFRVAVFHMTAPGGSEEYHVLKAAETRDGLSVGVTPAEDVNVKEDGTLHIGNLVVAGTSQHAVHRYGRLLLAEEPFASPVALRGVA